MDNQTSHKMCAIKQRIFANRRVSLGTILNANKIVCYTTNDRPSLHNNALASVSQHLGYSAETLAPERTTEKCLKIHNTLTFLHGGEICNIFKTCSFGPFINNFNQSELKMLHEILDPFSHPAFNLYFPNHFGHTQNATHSLKSSKIPSLMELQLLLQFCH